LSSRFSDTSCGNATSDDSVDGSVYRSSVICHESSGAVSGDFGGAWKLASQSAISAPSGAVTSVAVTAMSTKCATRRNEIAW